MSKTIWIKCKQVCEYSQQHTVTDEEYELLKNMYSDEVTEFETYDGERKLYRILERYIDNSDILDTAHEFASVRIELDKPKKKKTKKK